MLREIRPVRQKKLRIVIDIPGATVKFKACSIACQFQDMVNPQVNLVQ
jgi:hypothetical protein